MTTTTRRFRLSAPVKVLISLLDGAVVGLTLTHHDPALALHPYDGITFNRDVRGMKSQNNFARQVIVQVQNKKFRMIWPFDMAPKDVPLSWPVPAWGERK